MSDQCVSGGEDLAVRLDRQRSRAAAPPDIGRNLAVAAEGGVASAVGGVPNEREVILAATGREPGDDDLPVRLDRDGASAGEPLDGRDHPAIGAERQVE